MYSQVPEAETNVEAISRKMGPLAKIFFCTNPYIFLIQFALIHRHVCCLHENPYSHEIICQKH